MFIYDEVCLGVVLQRLSLEGLPEKRLLEGMRAGR